MGSQNSKGNSYSRNKSANSETGSKRGSLIRGFKSHSDSESLGKRNTTNTVKEKRAAFLATPNSYAYVDSRIAATPSYCYRPIVPETKSGERQGFVRRQANKIDEPSTNQDSNPQDRFFMMSPGGIIVGEGSIRRLKEDELKQSKQVLKSADLAPSDLIEAKSAHAPQQSMPVTEKQADAKPKGEEKENNEAIEQKNDGENKTPTKEETPKNGIDNEVRNPEEEQQHQQKSLSEDDEKSANQTTNNPDNAEGEKPTSDELSEGEKPTPVEGEEATGENKPEGENLREDEKAEAETAGEDKPTEEAPEELAEN